MLMKAFVFGLVVVGGMLIASFGAKTGTGQRSEISDRDMYEKTMHSDSRLSLPNYKLKSTNPRRTQSLPISVK